MLEAHNFIECLSMIEHYNFSSLELSDPDLYLCASRASWFSKVGPDDIECPVQSPALNPSEHFQDERQPRPPHLTSVPNVL